MALLQIAEPGQSGKPHDRRVAVGIDLGTTNSLVATVRNGKAEVLADETGDVLIPSVVHYGDSGTVVGKKARMLAVCDAKNTVVSVKRMMGRGKEDLQGLADDLPYDFVDEPLAIATRVGPKTPVEVSADILRHLRKLAELRLGDEIAGAVITVPAYFDDAQRQATKDAARLARLPVLRLLNEPTAAAVAYGLDSGEEGLHAIYDLGGGTFDISILRFSKGVFEVLATGGDTALGGDDMDRALAAWIMKKLGLELDNDGTMERFLLETSRDIKEQLSADEQVTKAIRLKGRDYGNVIVCRNDFEKLIEPLVTRTLMSCRRALKDAGVAREDIKDVVMVGGSTRVPYVRQKVGEFFGCQPLTSIDPDQVVAIGAARQADVLVGNAPDSDMLLLDVCPLSLGIETMGGLVEKIIPRNTPLPVARAQEFTTFKDGQTSMLVHVVQGEREMVKDCRSLARFVLKGFPPMAAGAARIKVTYNVDADGLLSVSAEETTSGTRAQIEVKPSYGLDPDDIARMIEESVEHAEEDLEARALNETKVEGERLLVAVEAALAEDGQLLEKEAQQALERHLEALRQSLAGHERSSIERAMADLDAASQEFAALRMNKRIQDALIGHSLDEVK